MSACARASSLRELLGDLKVRIRSIAPQIAVGDGALGFWRVLDEIFPTTRYQRCRVGMAANVLNKMPKAVTGITSGQRSLLRVRSLLFAIGSFARRDSSPTARPAS